MKQLISMHKRATLFSVLGNRGAIEWLRGYRDHEMGDDECNPGWQYMRGWVQADVDAADRELDRKLTTYRNNSSYLLGW
jgi:hypothetical protein